MFNGLLFLPAAGYCVGGAVTVGNGGVYISRDVRDATYPYHLEFWSNSCSPGRYDWVQRSWGESVRLVCLAQ